MDFINSVIVVLVGTAAAVIAGFILKALWDLFIKALAKANKRFGLWILKLRRERFNARAADLRADINSNTEAINRIDNRLKTYFKAELDEQYKEAATTKDQEKIKKFLESKQAYIDFGGTEDELLKWETQQLMCLCSRGPTEVEDAEIKQRVSIAPASKPTTGKKKELVGKH